MSLIIGSHVSFTKDRGLLGSLEDSLSYNSNTFMIYTGSPQTTARYEINNDNTTQALSLMKDKNINKDNIIVHAPYIVNIASNTNKEKYEFSINFLIEECKRVEALNLKYLVIHPGNYLTSTKEEAITNTTNALKRILSQTKITILLETMSGKGTEICSTFEEISKITKNIKNQIGVCIDTCHLNDAGYNLTNFDDILSSFDKIVGLNYLKCIHINDSKNEKSSHKDRHENIGFGTIGFDTLMKIIYHKRLENIPKILETPYINEKPPYKEEIEMIRSKTFDQNLKNKFN